MTREEVIKSALKFLVRKQQEQGSWGYADNDDTHEVSWDEIIRWVDTHNTAIKALEKQKAISELQPPTDNWENYADRLYDLAYLSGYNDGLVAKRGD